MTVKVTPSDYPLFTCVLCQTIFVSSFFIEIEAQQQAKKRLHRGCAYLKLKRSSLGELKPTWFYSGQQRGAVVENKNMLYLYVIVLIALCNTQTVRVFISTGCKGYLFIM